MKSEMAVTTLLALLATVRGGLTDIADTHEDCQMMTQLGRLFMSPHNDACKAFEEIGIVALLRVSDDDVAYGYVASTPAGEVLRLDNSSGGWFQCSWDTAGMNRVPDFA